MTCKCVSHKITGYLDGELPGHEMLAIRAHLHDCPACAAEAEALCSLKFQLANLPIAEAPADFEDRLLRAVRLEAGPSLTKRQVAARWGLGLVAASAASFAVMWFGVLATHAPESNGYVADSAPSGGTYEVSQDQAYATAADSLAGHGLVVTASYDR